MIRIELQVELNYDIDANGADFVFNIHAAQTACQKVSAENLVLSQPVVPHIHTDAATGTRYMRVRALPGPLKLSYAATLDITHYYEGCPSAAKDADGRTLQACFFLVRVSWKALEKAEVIVALEQAHFHAKVAEIASVLSRSFGESGMVWEVIADAPARVSRAAAA